MTWEAQREALRTSLVAVVPDKWSVYSWPNALAAAPAAIVGPGTPYRKPITMGGFGQGHEECRLRVTLLMPLAGGSDAYSVLETVMDLVIQGIEATAGMTWTGADLPGTVVNNNGAEYLAATVDVWVI